MPNIAVVGPSWPFRGGIARTTTALASALHARGSLSAFLVPARQYPRWLYPGGNDIDEAACLRLPYANACYSVLEPWTWASLVRQLRRAEPGAVVLPYWTAAWAPLQRAVLAAAPAAPVAVVHNPADHDAGRIARLAARGVLGRCRGFLCHAEAVAQLVRDRFPGRPVAVHPLPAVAPAPIERSAARARLGVPGDATAFLCFGLIRPYKGVDILLEAFAGLARDAPAVLLVAGEPWGKLGEELRARLSREDLAGRVVAKLEWVPEAETAAWFAAADVAVLPYRSATGSAVAAEAMGRGLPIVGSAVGGIAEVVEDARTGLLVPPGDVGALRRAMERLLAGPLRAELSAETLAAVRRWSWESYAEVLERLATVSAAAT